MDKIRVVEQESIYSKTTIHYNIKVAGASPSD